MALRLVAREAPPGTARQVLSAVSRIEQMQLILEECRPLLAAQANAGNDKAAALLGRLDACEAH